MGNLSNIESTLRSETLAEDAHNRALPEIEGLPAEKVIQVNAEIVGSVATIVGAKPKVEAIRKQIEVEVPKFPGILLQKVELYAQALLYAHSVYQISAEPKDDLPPLLEMANTTTETLLADARALARRGLIPPEALDACKAQPGYKNRANDLQLLYTVFDSHWDKVAGKCAVTREELEMASRLASRIIRLVGLREQSPAAVAAAADKRARAFTLLINTWDEIRRAVTYARWKEGDADEIAPSIYAGKKRRQPEEPEQPEAPAPTPPVTPVNRNLNNLPGGSPFIA